MRAAPPVVDRVRKSSSRRRMIAAFFVSAVYESMDAPEGWMADPTLWDARTVYMHLRLATELEKLLFVCPSWYDAREFSCLLSIFTCMMYNSL